MNQQSLFFTAQEQSDNFRQRLREGFKGACPCCGRFAQIYKRRIHTGIAMQLISLYRAGGANNYLHFTKFAALGTGRDFTIARYWKLICRQPVDENEDKKHSGSWMLTPLGLDFVKNRITIFDRALIYDDVVISFEGKNVDIAQALGNKFSYAELMGHE